MSLFKKKTNYGKIIAISVAAVAVAGVVAVIIYKLVKKYKQDEIACECDDLLDECDDCDFVIDDAEEAEEAAI